MSDTSSSIQFTDNGIVVNVAKAKAGPEALTEGRYEVFIARCEQRTSSKGNEMLVFALEVDGGEHTGLQVWTNVALVENSLWKLQTIIEVLTGEPCPQDEINIRPEQFVGRRCAVDLKPVEWNDKVYNDVVEWYPAATVTASTPGTSTSGPTTEWDDEPF